MYWQKICNLLVVTNDKVERRFNCSVTLSRGRSIGLGRGRATKHVKSCNHGELSDSRQCIIFMREAHETSDRVITSSR